MENDTRSYVLPYKRLTLNSSLPVTQLCIQIEVAVKNLSYVLKFTFLFKEKKRKIRSISYSYFLKNKYISKLQAVNSAPFCLKGNLLLNRIALPTLVLDEITARAVYCS